MDELKKALESMLSLVEEYATIECFDNGIYAPDGMNEGVTYAIETINSARLVLLAHMTEQEKR